MRTNMLLLLLFTLWCRVLLSLLLLLLLRNSADRRHRSDGANAHVPRLSIKLGQLILALLPTKRQRRCKAGQACERAVVLLHKPVHPLVILANLVSPHRASPWLASATSVAVS